MIVKAATFWLLHRTHGRIKVDWLNKIDGTPFLVVVCVGAKGSPKKRFRIENHKNRYRPCATHAKELAWSCVEKPRTDNFAKRRAEEQQHDAANPPVEPGSLRVFK